jgi:hypothetical protein
MHWKVLKGLILNYILNLKKYNTDALSLKFYFLIRNSQNGLLRKLACHTVTKLIFCVINQMISINHTVEAHRTHQTLPSLVYKSYWHEA